MLEHFARPSEGHFMLMPNAEIDWERRYRASIEEADRRADEVAPRWLRRVEPVVFAIRAWCAVWLVLGLLGFGLRAFGVRVPAIVGVPIFLGMVFGLYWLMRREAGARRRV